jgi:hypothetical protein
MPPIIQKRKPAEKPATERGSWPEFTKKYGETVRKAGVTLVPQVLLTGMGELKLKPMEVVVLLQLIACWGPAGPHPFPSRKRLMKSIGCDKRTLDRAISSLAARGLIEKRARSDRRLGRRANEYDLGGLIARLAPLARAAINRKRRREEQRRAAESE